MHQYFEKLIAKLFLEFTRQYFDNYVFFILQFENSKNKFATFFEWTPQI